MFVDQGLSEQRQRDHPSPQTLLCGRDHPLGPGRSQAGHESSQCAPTATGTCENVFDKCVYYEVMKMQMQITEALPELPGGVSCRACTMWDRLEGLQRRSLGRK